MEESTGTIRFAAFEDLERVNVLRKQVNDLHVAGKPEIFKEGFPDELQAYVYAVFGDPDKRILVYEIDGTVCAFAVLHHVVRPETPYMRARVFLDIDEFCVDEAYRRRGIATEMIAYVRSYAKTEGIERIELNMWEFNRDALEFYEKVGFVTYRRYMELNV